MEERAQSEISASTFYVGTHREKRVYAFLRVWRLQDYHLSYFSQLMACQSFGARGCVFAVQEP